MLHYFFLFLTHVNCETRKTMDKNIIMSKQSQKKTLSHKKGTRETVKLTLANPYGTYFPILTEKDAADINKALDTLPKLKPDKVNVPISAIKNVPKEERKKVRESYNNRIVIDNEIRSNLTFGVNDVVKLLEKNELCSILIADDVNPLFMVKHVIDIAVLKNVPVLMVPKLRAILKNNTGISGMVVAIKRGVVDGSVLSHINDSILRISYNYPVPQNHMHYDSYKVESDDDGDIQLGENMQNLDLKKDHTVMKTNKDFMLRRNSMRYRAFVPGGHKFKMDVENSGFIGFSDGDVVKVHSTNYQGLKVKRLRSNKDRKKKLKINF